MHTGQVRSENVPVADCKYASNGSRERSMFKCFAIVGSASKKFSGKDVGDASPILFASDSSTTGG